MHVLISGAGIAGPTLAWYLAKAGARVTVVEKAQSMLAQGQNIDLAGSAVTVMKKMGALDEIRRMNTTEKGTRLIGPDGRPFASFPVKQDHSISPTSEFEILRGDLAQILYEASRDLAGVEYKFGVTVKSVVSNDDEAVRVELSNGEVQQYDLLVAADGQWSNVRKLCFAPEQVGINDLGLYAAYWTIPRLPRDEDWWGVYFALESRSVSIRPDPHGTMRATLTKMPLDAGQKQAWQKASRNGRQAQEEILRREFADVGWEAQRFLDSLADAHDFYLQPMQQIKMSKWYSSRVVCLGDAAYAPTPLTGMGTSLAIIGAYVLAGELSKLGDGDHPSKAFGAYDTKFRPHVEKTQYIPFFVPGIAHPRTAWSRWALQTLIFALSKVVAITWLAKRLTTESVEEDDNGFPLPHYPVLEADEGSK